MNNLRRPSNAGGRSVDELYTDKSVIPDALKRGGPQAFGQQHVPEFAIEQPWGDSMDPLWQQDRHWSMDNLHEVAAPQPTPNPMELGLFPQRAHPQAQAYLGENGGAQSRLGPIDLSDEGEEHRMLSGLWPNGGPAQREAVAWYTSQVSLNPSVVDHEIQRITPSPKPSKRIREVHIPRASQKETIATALQEESEKPYKCERCPARFARKRDCERHGRSIHTGSKLYYCKGCGEGFVRSDARGRHWKLNPECHQVHLQIVGSSNRSSPSA